MYHDNALMCLDESKVSENESAEFSHFFLSLLNLQALTLVLILFRRPSTFLSTVTYPDGEGALDFSAKFSE